MRQGGPPIKTVSIHAPRIAPAALVLIVLAGGSLSALPDASGTILRRFPTTYHVKVSYVLDENTLVLEPDSGFGIRILVPIPTTDDYHDVGPVSVTGGRIVKFDNADERIVAATARNRLPERVTVEYDVSVYRIHVDFDRMKTIHPYDTTAASYRRYTQAEDYEIDSPEVRRIADEVWRGSTDFLDYARGAYRWIQKTLRWTTQGSYNSISETLSNGGGDCGALHHLYIALLRNKGIPARHVVGGVIGDPPEFGGHMWCEFYLERHGWIPADVAVFGSVPCIGYASGRELGYYRGGGYEYTLDGERSEIGSVQHPFESHWYGKVPSGAFSYRTEFQVTVVRESEIRAAYNADANRESLTAGILERIQADRRAHGLPEYAYAADLGRVLTNRMRERSENGRELDLFREMVGIQYVSNGFLQWTGGLSDASYDTVGTVTAALAGQEDLFTNPHFTEVAVGYWFDGSHQVTVALTRRKPVAEVSAKDTAAETGASFLWDCPAGPPAGSVWGTDVYTADSSIATAARHAGLVGERGGRVRVTMLPGRAAYEGSARNGVESGSWGAYESSFRLSGE